MTSRKIYWIIVVLLTFSIQNLYSGDGTKYSRMECAFNPTSVINSAYIGDKNNLEISFPDYQSYSHARFSLAFDSVAMHLGLGLLVADLGFSLRLFSISNNNPITVNVIVGVGAYANMFLRGNFMLGIIDNKYHQVGTQIGYGIESGNVFYYTEDCWFRLPNTNLNLDIYYTFKFNSHAHFSTSFGTSRIYASYYNSDDALISVVRMKISLGLSLKYYF